MQRSTRLVLTFVLGLTLLMGGFLFMAFWLVGRGETARIPDDAWLTVQLAGGIPDEAPEEPLPLPGLRHPPPTLVDIRRALLYAKDDRRIKGVVMDLSDFAAGWGVSQELREIIRDFRDSGKQVISYLESGGDREYYVALAGDKIYLAPEGTLFLNGISLEAQFFKDTLDKVGVEAEFYHIGEYKSAPESYTRNTMSDTHKEVLNAIVDSLYKQLLNAMVEGRGMTQEEAAAYIDDFSLAGPKLVEARIVDGLQYQSQVLEDLNKGEAPETVSLKDYQASLGNRGNSGAALAVLYINGEIRSGESRQGGFTNDSSVGSETIIEAMKDIEEDEDVQGLLLRIDSPGGSALAADMMWQSIVHFKEKTKKPVVVSMSNLAASGGYWIATAGDEIVAHPGTLTGSIGVFFGKFNLTNLLQKVGANIETVSRGKYADMFNATRKFNDDEANKINTWLKTTYDTFLDRVSKARKITPEEVDKVARGRVWTGEQAVDKKLVDALGGFDEGIKRLKLRANLKDTDPVHLEYYPHSDNVFQRLTRQLNASADPGIPAEVKGLLNAFTQAREQVETDAPAPEALLPYVMRIQ